MAEILGSKETLEIIKLLRELRPGLFDPDAGGYRSGHLPAVALVSEAEIRWLRERPIDWGLGETAHP
jgi:hypothetical protein